MIYKCTHTYLGVLKKHGYGQSAQSVTCTMAMVRVLSEVYNGHGLCSVTDLYSGHSQSAQSVTCTMAMTRVLSDVYNGHDQSAQ